ncbi:hypothetical protein B0J12DRAFT_696332 [Macrophomina phaseolina]|uniref:Uncharacterized protein n=1 Tax=Macrophomina phaseolina TaxID=35725 RepID=A0ABQ8GK96_9PEZI|nr:hypothetical protein B0J12DRAFT_696332 [Macrophomina phaseolina]
MVRLEIAVFAVLAAFTPFVTAECKGPGCPSEVVPVSTSTPSVNPSVVIPEPQARAVTVTAVKPGASNGGGGNRPPGGGAVIPRPPLPPPPPGGGGSNSPLGQNGRNERCDMTLGCYTIPD